MKSRWQKLGKKRGWSQAGTDLCWQELAANYGSPSRHYHNLSHIDDCLDQLIEIGPDNKDALLLGVWFHDVIYETNRTDNEAASGRFAVQWLKKLGEPGALCAEVDRLINVTDHKITPETEAERLLVDIDLSILGRSAEEYQIYAENIRQEYSAVPDDAYRSGRAAVLQSFLARPSIFLTPLMKDRYQTRAKINLRQELEDLTTKKI